MAKGNHAAVYTDEAGRTWLPYSLTWTNEIDSQTFSVIIFAIDYVHALDQLEFIKANGRIDGQIVGSIAA